MTDCKSCPFLCPETGLTVAKQGRKKMPKKNDDAAATAEKIPAVPPQPQCERPFLTCAELQQKIPVSRRTIFAWRKAGWLPSVQNGAKILFH
jgi:hypothetical protein